MKNVFCFQNKGIDGRCRVTCLGEDGFMAPEILCAEGENPRQAVGGVFPGLYFKALYGGDYKLWWVAKYCEPAGGEPRIYKVEADLSDSMGTPPSLEGLAAAPEVGAAIKLYQEYPGKEYADREEEMMRSVAYWVREAKDEEQRREAARMAEAKKLADEAGGGDE